MAKRSGPVSRVRNRRNVDLSMVPLPYPQLVGLSYDGFNNDGTTGIVVMLKLRMAFLNEAYEDIMAVEGDVSMITLDGNPCTEIVQNPAAGETLEFRFAGFNAAADQQFYVPPWVASIRGPLGEWLVPYVRIIG